MNLIYNNSNIPGVEMKNKIPFIIILFYYLAIVGCGFEQHVLWNFTSESGGEVKVKVREEYNLFSRVLCVRIDGDEVVRGNCEKDKKNEYNAEYKGKKVKVQMIYNSQTKDEIVEVYIEGAFVGEFVF